MAYEYNMDPMGSYTGYDSGEDTGETEQERQKRLREEAAKKATPVTQTIKTNPVTGEQQVTITGTARDLSAANPRTPTVAVAGPVNPADAVYQRQIQAESGGQHIDPRTGQMLTSPKGAQGIAQIMPATAANPGYGIKPATPQEVATPEGNMAFGNRYKEGMLKLFGGDQQKATAAYNAGPGAIQKAEQQAQTNGGSWTDYIPKETMGYLGKVFGNMIPSAQAGTLPAGQAQKPATITPVAPDQNPSTEIDSTGNVVSKPTTDVVPQAQAGAAPAPAGPVSPYALTATGGAPGLRMPDAMQQQQQQQQVQRQDQMNQFQQATASPDAMIEYMNRKDVPDDLKTAMKINHFEALSAEKRQKDIEDKVKKTIAEKPQDIPRLLNDKTEDGSIAKAFLYSLIGFKSGADAEVAKMNLPGKWAPAEDADGKTGMVQYSTSGKPLRGVNSDNTQMTPEQLSAFASGGLQKGVHVTKTENYIDPATGQIVTHSMLSNNKEKFTMGGKPLSAEFDRSKLVPEKQFTAAEDRRVDGAIKKLRDNIPSPTEQQTLQALIGARVPNRRIEQEMGYAPGTLGQGGGRQGAGEPAFNQPGTAATAAPATTTAAPAAASMQPVSQGLGPKPAMPGLRAELPGESKDHYNSYKKQVEKDYESELDTWKKKQDRMEKKAENLPAIQSQAEDSIATVQDLLTHPGFENAIGVTWNPAAMMNLPGTDARDFRAKYKQLQGEQFLSAYNQLRGGGAISDTEGKAAKEAIAAMQDPYISEAEFKRNAQIYIDTVKRGVNRQRVEVGLDPAYPDVPVSRTAGAPTGGVTTGTTSSGNKFKRVQ